MASKKTCTNFFDALNSSRHREQGVRSDALTNRPGEGNGGPSDGRVTVAMWRAKGSQKSSPTAKTRPDVDGYFFACIPVCFQKHTMNTAEEINEVRGSELRPEDQQHVLAAYVHRFTGEHKPSWANRDWKDGKPYPVQFASDRDWLEHTFFSVRQNGRLDRRVRTCTSNPTWPEGNPLQQKNPL